MVVFRRAVAIGLLYIYIYIFNVFYVFGSLVMCIFDKDFSWAANVNFVM